MTFGLTPFAGAPFGGATDAPIVSTDDWLAMLENPTIPRVYIVQLKLIDRANPLTELFGSALGTRALGRADGEEDDTIPVVTYVYYGDNTYNTKTTDIALPSQLVEPRMLQAIDTVRQFPIQPQATDRGQAAGAKITLANADGELSSLFIDNTIDGQSIPLWLVPQHSPFSVARKVDEMIATGVSGNRDKITISLRGPKLRIETPFQESAYRGTGGLEGDGSVINDLKPLTYGECFNVRPKLILRAYNIYQVHDGAIFALAAVRDRGVPMTVHEACTTFFQLVASEPPAGKYSYHLASGTLKVNLGDALADYDNDVRVDVLGDATGGYIRYTGPILRRIAKRRAGMADSEIALSSFESFKDGVVGYHFDGSQRTTKVSDVFSQMLRPYNGYYGRLAGSVNLSIGSPPDLDSVGAAHHLTEADFISFDPLANPSEILFEMSYGYRKNWHPHAEEDLATSLSAAEKKPLYEDSQTVVDGRGNVLSHHPDAIRLDKFDSYYRDAGPAQTQLNAVMDYMSGDTMFFRAVVPGFGVNIPDTAVLEVDYPFYFSSPKKFSITGRRNRTAKDTVEFILRGNME